MDSRRGARRDVCEPVPRVPNLHDGGSAQHRHLHASPVHGQEHRADRRSRHQYRRKLVLSRAWHAADAGAAKAGQCEHPSRRARSRRHAMKPLVLIVEDEAPLVTMLRYNLEREGFAVCEAGDGEEALVQIAERKPDLVLLDWMLPLVSGIEVCRRIRRSRETRSLPVIILTARSEETDRVRGLDSD